MASGGEARAGERRAARERLAADLVRVHGSVAGPRPRPALPTGLPALDALLAAGGLPRGRLTALAGTAAVALLHRAVAEATRAGTAAWVDPLGRLAAAALVAAGVDLAELLVSRPRPARRRSVRRPSSSRRRRTGPFDLLVVDAPALTAHQAGRLSDDRPARAGGARAADGAASLVAGRRRPRAARRPSHRLAAGRLPAARPDGRGRRPAAARRARRRGGDESSCDLPRPLPPLAGLERAAAGRASARGARALAPASPLARRAGCACLLLPAWPLQVAARARPELLARPAAVVDERPGDRRLGRRRRPPASGPA